MKNARERHGTAAADSSRAVPPTSDQETRKISAFQLAEVLARVDGPKPPEPERTISGARPIVRREEIQPYAESERVSSTVPTTANDAVDVAGGTYPVIERPVALQQVVNATSAAGAGAPAGLAPAPADAMRALTASASEAEAAASRILTSARRTSRLFTVALLMAVVALAAIVVLAVRY